MTDSLVSNRQLRHPSQSTCQMRVSAFVRDSPGSPSTTHDSLRLHCLHPMFSVHGPHLADCEINQRNLLCQSYCESSKVLLRIVSSRGIYTPEHWDIK
ncbi:hypothetical protein TNCT_613361 [Trichonephila clavata]|uniref:Uncharacterized protein n=1 Tax=Trichonephila clavata TaxID=2740835 RepID=A0A8X6LZ40_TRICU|nr:hypothetical protein TNCT_613361 [Trichonephila clavata]